MRVCWSRSYLLHALSNLDIWQTFPIFSFFLLENKNKDAILDKGVSC